jgi:hypothetical protein
MFTKIFTYFENLSDLNKCVSINISVSDSDEVNTLP